jgi:hypothetical protein
MKILSGKTGNQSRRLMLYGVHGVGKSTFAAQSPDCLFLNVEDGLHDIDCNKTEHLTSLGDLMAALKWLALGDHQFKWVAIDTLDHLEKLIWHSVAEEAGKSSIADIGYGAGFKRALSIWGDIQKALDFLRRRFSVGTIALAHCEIKRFDSPESDSYDRYQPALHDKASQLWQEWSDEVLFASYRTFVRKEEQGFGKERAVATGQGERYLRTVETAAVLAKNRLSLPAELPFEWSAYATWISRPTASAPEPTEGNIAGVVVDGSSKQQPTVASA